MLLISIDGEKYILAHENLSGFETNGKISIPKKQQQILKAEKQYCTVQIEWFAFIFERTDLCKMHCTRKYRRLKLAMSVV